MKNLHLIIILIFSTLIFTGSSVVNAQSESKPTPFKPERSKEHQLRRPNLLAELILTPEQIRQIRRLNLEKRPAMREIQQRLREASRNLDHAIYAESIDDSQIQLRLKEVEAAQIEVINMRSQTELAIRRILTPEQLSKFRKLRQQFLEKMGERQNRQENRQFNFLKRRLHQRHKQVPEN